MTAGQVAAWAMPIRPQHRWLYPIDWRELSRVIGFGRAKGRCEGCGRPHGLQVRHMGDGRWWDDVASAWRDGRSRTLRRRLPAPSEGRAPRKERSDQIAAKARKAERQR